MRLRRKAWPKAKPGPLSQLRCQLPFQGSHWPVRIRPGFLCVGSAYRPHPPLRGPPSPRGRFLGFQPGVCEFARGFSASVLRTALIHRFAVPLPQGEGFLASNRGYTYSPGGSPHRFWVPMFLWCDCHRQSFIGIRCAEHHPSSAACGRHLPRRGRLGAFVHMFVRHNYCLHRFPPAFPQELSTLSTGFSTGLSVENLDNCRFFGWAVKKTPQLFAQLWSSSVYRTPIFSLFPQSNRSLAEKTRWSSWLAFLWKSTWMQPSSTTS